MYFNNFILRHICKAQLIQIFLGANQITNVHYHLMNVFFCLICLIFEIFNIDVSLVISLSGAVCGFILVYLIPIYLHLHCLYGKNEENLKQNLLGTQPK